MKLNKNGFSLLETIGISIAVGAIAIIAVQVSRTSSNLLSRTKLEAQIESDLTQAQKMIRRIGRAADVCRVVVVGSAKALECDVDFNTPPNGSLTKTRFVVSGNNLNFEHQNAGTWKTKASYQGVNNFTICDSPSMLANTCTVTPNALKNIANLTTNRYFRYQLSGYHADKEVQSIIYSGAFYVRNPTPFGAGVAYQWSQGGAQ